MQFILSEENWKFSDGTTMNDDEEHEPFSDEFFYEQINVQSVKDLTKNLPISSMSC